MEKVEFEHENNFNYLVFTPQNGAKGNDYQQKMIARNTINGLLQVSIKNINNNQVYYYDITSKQQMSKLYEYNKITVNDVQSICISISEMVKAVNDFMLDLDCVIISPEYMYIDMNSKKASFVYCPSFEGEFSKSMKSLFEYIIEHFDHSISKDDLMKVYEIYQKIIHDDYNPQNLAQMMINESDAKKTDGIHVMDEVTNLDCIQQKQIKDLVADENILEEQEGIDRKYVKGLKIIRTFNLIFMLYLIGTLFVPQIAVLKTDLAVIVAIIAASLFINVRITKKIKKADSMSNIKIQNYSQEYSKKINESGSDLTNIKNNDYKQNIYDEDKNGDCKQKHIEIGNTILLSEYCHENKKPLLRLVPDNTDEYKDLSEEKRKLKSKVLEISGFPCVIGSMPSYCDVVIDNRIISRMHACIKSEDNNCYIEDMNSTNGTFVNEIRIKPDEKKIIRSGDTIQMAALSYVVEIS